MFHLKVLNKNQLEILKYWKLSNRYKFYLAGGTALAVQLGHRTSIDFDFYSQQHFEGKLIVGKLEEHFSSLKVSLQKKDTLLTEIEETGLSFFYYKYPLVGSLMDFQTIKIASLEDIAAMKMAAIVQRGIKRDFIDIYYLLEKYSLKRLLNFTVKKYPGYQKMLVLRALIYFEDAEKEKKKRPVKVFDPEFSWETAKKKIFEEVRRYQLGMIKK